MHDEEGLVDGGVGPALRLPGTRGRSGAHQHTQRRKERCRQREMPVPGDYGLGPELTTKRVKSQSEADPAGKEQVRKL